MKLSRADLFLIVIVVELVLLHAWQFAGVDGSVPVHLTEHFDTMNDSNREWTMTVKQVEENEAQLLMTAAGSIMGIIVLYFIFGTRLVKTRFGVLCASSALLTAGFSVWMGYQVINEIKWLLRFSISVKFWPLSRYDSFQILQLNSLYLAFLVLLPYLYIVLKERYAESE